MKSFTSKTQKIGEFGEKLSIKWLKDKGYLIIDNNWNCSFGEIDIIALKDNLIHFIEVKSVKVNLSSIYDSSYNPAENITHGKLQRLIMSCHEYINKIGLDGADGWQLDIMLVRFDVVLKQAEIQIIQSVSVE